jgi:hypothetical protein
VKGSLLYYGGWQTTPVDIKCGSGGKHELETA